MDSALEIAHSISDQYLAGIPADYDGRYSELAKPDVVDTLLRGFSAGLKPQDCCDAAGISLRTYQRWLEHAEANPSSAYGSFVAALKKARAAGKLALLGKIQAAADKPQFWTAAAWTLERTDPEQFALRKDNADTPKVIVQIGAGAGDVKVGVIVQGGETLSPTVEAQRLSPPLSHDMHSLSVDNQGANVNITSLITPMPREPR